MHLIPRLGRAYALARWPVDWGISFVTPILVDKGVAAGYGYKHASYSIFYPDSLFGEFVLVTVSASEAYADFSQTLSRLSSSAESMSIGSTNFFDDSVTKISSEGVFHGSSSRS